MWEVLTYHVFVIFSFINLTNQIKVLYIRSDKIGSVKLQTFFKKIVLYFSIGIAHVSPVSGFTDKVFANYWSN